MVSCRNFSSLAILQLHEELVQFLYCRLKSPICEAEPSASLNLVVIIKLTFEGFINH
jgi:hypothetical protein